MIATQLIDKYEILSAAFQNLFESKVVYYEKFVAIVRLDDIVITPERFSATATPLLKIERKDPLTNYFPDKPWKLGTQFSLVNYSHNRFSGYGGGWLIWAEPELVKQVEQLTKQGKFEEALQLTYYKL